MNQIIGYFANSSIKFINILHAKLQPFQLDTGRTTAKGVCGLVIPIKGHAHFSLNGVVYEMNQETILHAGSQMEINIETFEQEWEYFVIHYQVIHSEEAFKNIQHQHFMLTVEKEINLFKKIHYLVEHQANPDYISKIQIQNEFLRLLEDILLSARNGQMESKNDVIFAALEYIQIHYAQEIQVGAIAEKFGLERRKFSYLFEQLTGLTPIQYITEYRIEKAKELLRMTDIPIAIIAELVGYFDSFYFSRVFKKHTNITPSHYRKEYGKSLNPVS